MGLFQHGRGAVKVLITGVCGFVGSALAKRLPELVEGLQIVGLDNLMRPGSETNRAPLERMGVRFIHGDLRVANDLSAVGACDWVIDAAANPSVLAGLDGAGSSRRLFEHNLGALGNVLEYCREHRAGLLLLSSSRVYSVAALASVPLRAQEARFVIDEAAALPRGLTARGIGADFSTVAPVSLYGATKLASETLALEYGAAFGFPVWVTRCGVLAGAGQFGTPDQGIFAYWVNAHLRRRALRYIGFDGSGRQTRDALHPNDLAELLAAQMRTARRDGQRIYTAGGGVANAVSLADVTGWCNERFGPHVPAVDATRRAYDIPWVAMDNDQATADFAWTPKISHADILEDIAVHAEAHPEWLELGRA